jgi:glycosyltransferase involved in cell wall biosynthesis
MKATFITYADLGKFKNLKTKDILSTISFFKNKNLILLVISRLGKGEGDFIKINALPFLAHFFIGGIHKIFKSFPSRKIEEKIFDFLGSQTNIPESIVFFHPPKFPKIIKKAKNGNCVCVGIAVNSSPNHTKLLIEEELKNQKITSFDFSKLLERDYSKDMDYLIALSEFSKSTYIQDGFPAEKIYVANLDIDTKRFSPGEHNNNEFVVLFPASMIGILKGLQYVVDAWQGLNIPNKKLIILGERYLWPIEMENKYKKIILEDNSIIELGMVSDVEFYMKKANVVVLPSFTEGFSRAIAESMSCGVPVITTNNSTDTKNFFIDKKHGLIVPVGDSQKINEMIMYLFENKEVREKMGENARECVLNKKLFAESVFDIYNDISRKTQSK